MPPANWHQSSAGLERSIMLRAVRPGLAPTLTSSPSRIAYLRLAKMMVVTSSRSRAWVHRADRVYIAEPSACSPTTRRPGAAMAAPTLIGIPSPIAPPVSIIQSCFGAARVLAKKPRPKEIASSMTMALSGSSAASDWAKPSGVTAPVAKAGRGAAAGTVTAGAPR
jgi:hypothetical protein